MRRCYEDELVNRFNKLYLYPKGSAGNDSAVDDKMLEVMAKMRHIICKFWALLHRVSGTNQAAMTAQLMTNP